MKDHLNQLNKNIEKLLNELQSLKKENASLHDELSELKSNSNTSSENGSSMNQEEVESIKIQIDENIQEIDKCIEMLNNR